MFTILYKSNQHLLSFLIPPFVLIGDAGIYVGGDDGGSNNNTSKTETDIK